VAAGYAPRDSVHSEALVVFADAVRAALPDADVTLRFNLLDDGYRASDILDLTESGELTLCYFSSSYLVPRAPSTGVIDTPFLFDDLAHAHRALDGALGERLAAATEAATGFRVLGYWDNGFRHLTNRLRPVRTVADCAGMTVRLQPNPVHEAMISAWGAVPVPLDLKDGIAAIAAGEVDAQENPLANTVAYGVEEHQPFATMTGHVYGARGIYAHAATVDAWSADVRATVQRAVDAAIAFQRTAAAAKEVALRAQLEAHGVAFVELTAEERGGFVAPLGPLLADARRRQPELLSLVEEARAPQ
jgi:C4-dicarboxylate-binding protein DctP